MLVLLEQLIAARDGRVHCLLPFGQVAPAVDREQGIVRQPAQQMLGSEHLDPWGREFKRKREGVETLADPDDRGAVRRSSSWVKPATSRSALSWAPKDP